MKAHIIENGRVINTIEIERLDLIPELAPKLVDASQGGTIGDLWDGQTFKKPSRFATIDEAKAGRLKELADYRYGKEVAGITVSGIEVKTDRESQAMIVGAKVLTDLKPDKLLDWKGKAGWIKLNKIQIEAIGNAVGDHVQACFTKERTHAEAIGLFTTIEAVEAYDITTGW